MHKRFKRILSGILAFTLLFAAMNVQAKTVAQYNKEISAVKQKQKQNAAEAAKLQAELSELKAETKSAEEYQKNLEKQIKNHQERIDLAMERIEELNDNIEYLEGEIKKADAEYADTLAKWKERLRALYISGSNELTSLEILLDSTSLYDYTLRSEAVKSVTRHDNELMDEIKAYMLSTQDQRNDLSEQKQELAEQKKDLEAAQAELRVLEEENARLIEELHLESAQTQQQLAENERESASYMKELNQLIADRNAQAARDEAARKAAEEAAKKQQAAASGGSSNKGSEVLNTGSLKFRWPLSGYGKSYITQHYGGMFSGSSHKGVDIGVPYGTPIYAAESGQVLSAEYHWSWGNNVLIWHNGTFSTRYAHCSKLAVKAGDYVEKGQVVGYVGSTGNSTGNHLHFEIYQNGSRVNPENYV